MRVTLFRPGGGHGLRAPRTLARARDAGWCCSGPRTASASTAWRSPAPTVTSRRSDACRSMPAPPPCLRIYRRCACSMPRTQGTVLRCCVPAKFWTSFRWCRSWWAMPRPRRSARCRSGFVGRTRDPHRHRLRSQHYHDYATAQKRPRHLARDRGRCVTGHRLRGRLRAQSDKWFAVPGAPARTTFALLICATPAIPPARACCSG